MCRCSEPSDLLFFFGEALRSRNAEVRELSVGAPLRPSPFPALFSGRGS